jgi:hypothetical protein
MCTTFTQVDSLVASLEAECPAGGAIRERNWLFVRQFMAA